MDKVKHFVHTAVSILGIVLRVLVIIDQALGNEADMS